MIDSSTQKKVIANQEGNRIRVKVYSYGDMPHLEDHLYDKLGIEIDSFRPIKDLNGKDIGSELIYENFNDINLFQNTIDEFEIEKE